MFCALVHSGALTSYLQTFTSLQLD